MKIIQVGYTPPNNGSTPEKRFSGILLKAIEPYFNINTLEETISDINKYWEPAIKETTNPANFKIRSRTLVKAGSHILFFSPSYGVFSQLFGEDQIFILKREIYQTFDIEEIETAYKAIRQNRRKQ